MARAVIFVNGKIASLEPVRRLFQPDDFFIAADGGSRYALALGIQPEWIVGDLDSIRPADQAKLSASGSRIIQYSPDKNETDFELALGLAVEAGYRELLVVGAFGGRLDQTLGNLSVLSGGRFAAVDICVDDGLEEARFVRRQIDVQGDPGDVVSLIPWGGTVEGITTEGLRWPLKDENLSTEKTRGISNEMTGQSCAVAISSGLLLLIHRRGQPDQVLGE